MFYRFSQIDDCYKMVLKAPEETDNAFMYARIIEIDCEEDDVFFTVQRAYSFPKFSEVTGNEEVFTFQQILTHDELQYELGKSEEIGLMDFIKVISRGIRSLDLVLAEEKMERLEVEGGTTARKCGSHITKTEFGEFIEEHFECESCGYNCITKEHDYCASCGDPLVFDETD